MRTRYGRLPRPNCDPVDNPRNAILLRSDIHSSFDSKRFSFIPKPEHAAISEVEPTVGGPLQYVTHIFNSPEPHELTALYHNVRLQPISGVAPEFLFVRFAWTLFQHVHIFLQAGVPRRLALFEAPTGLTEAGSEVTSTVKTWSAEQCRLMPLRNKSRSSSPRHRKPDDAFVEDDGPVPRGRKRERHGGGAFTSSLESSSLGPDTPTDGPWNPEPLEEQGLDADLLDDGSWDRYCERSEMPFDTDARLQ